MGLRHFRLLDMTACESEANRKNIQHGDDPIKPVQVNRTFQPQIAAFGCSTVPRSSTMRLKTAVVFLTFSLVCMISRVSYADSLTMSGVGGQSTDGFYVDPYLFTITG